MRGDCSASRPKHHPPCGMAVDGLAEGYNNERKVDEPSASVRNGVEKCEATVGQATFGETWMRWNDF